MDYKYEVCYLSLNLETKGEEWRYYKTETFGQATSLYYIGKLDNSIKDCFIRDLKSGAIYKDGSWN